MVWNREVFLSFNWVRVGYLMIPLTPPDSGSEHLGYFFYTFVQSSLMNLWIIFFTEELTVVIILYLVFLQAAYYCYNEVSQDSLPIRVRLGALILGQHHL